MLINGIMTRSSKDTPIIDSREAAMELEANIYSLEDWAKSKQMSSLIHCFYTSSTASLLSFSTIFSPNELQPVQQNKNITSASESPLVQHIKQASQFLQIPSREFLDPKGIVLKFPALTHYHFEKVHFFFF